MAYRMGRFQVAEETNWGFVQGDRIKISGYYTVWPHLVRLLGGEAQSTMTQASGTTQV